MSVLRSIESKLESLFEGVFGRAFRSNVQPVELARKLVKEMDDHRSVSVSRVYVPNEYTVYLSPGDRKQFDELFRSNETLVIADGGAVERGTLGVYLNENDFVADLKGTAGADAVAKMREDVRKMLMERTNEKDEVLAARYKTENERVTEEYLKLSKKTGLSPDSPELLQKAIDARIMNSAILFEHVNYGGSWRPVAIPAPCRRPRRCRMRAWRSCRWRRGRCRRHRCRGTSHRWCWARLCAWRFGAGAPGRVGAGVRVFGFAGAVARD